MKNIRWKLAQWITLKATDFSDWLLRKRRWRYAASDYQNMPDGSLGKELITYMNQNNIPFKANLVRHDLKHILLGYEMRMPDELRIHAFLVGNRSYNLVAIAYLLVCISIVPESIRLLKKDFQRGRKAICLKRINLENHVQDNLYICRNAWNILPD